MQQEVPKTRVLHPSETQGRLSVCLSGTQMLGKIVILFIPSWNIFLSGGQPSKLVLLQHFSEKELCCPFHYHFIHMALTLFEALFLYMIVSISELLTLNRGGVDVMGSHLFRSWFCGSVRTSPAGVCQLLHAPVVICPSIWGRLV